MPLHQDIAFRSNQITSHHMSSSHTRLIRCLTLRRVHPMLGSNNKLCTLALPAS